MGGYISLSSEVGGRVLIGACALKGKNTVRQYFNATFRPYFFNTLFTDFFQNI